MDGKGVIYFLKAGAGDCFLIELADKNCILIDCGYKSTYESELKPLLIDIANDGGHISLFVVTHIDEDHIGGAISLLKENGDNRNPSVITIENIWFNGIFTICSNNMKIAQHICDCLRGSDLEKYRELSTQFQKLINSESGFISASQAKAFEQLCRDNHYKLNGGENNLLKAGTKILFEDCKITVLSPGEKELQGFSKWIGKELVQYLGKNYLLNKSNFVNFLERMIMATSKDYNGTCGIWEISSTIPDINDWIGTSTLAPMNDVNRTSIVLELEYCGKKMLFMGDSESGDWINRAAKHYDIVKLSHHGTTKPNLELLNQVTFDKVLISTNGSRNHPEDELLARLIKNGTKDIFFNYDIRRKDDLLILQDIYNINMHFDESEIIIM